MFSLRNKEKYLKIIPVTSSCVELKLLSSVPFNFFIQPGLM